MMRWIQSVVGAIFDVGSNSGSTKLRVCHFLREEIDLSGYFAGQFLLWLWGSVQ